MYSEQAVELSLRAEPRAVRLVRDVVDEFCRAHYITGLLVDDLKVVISEACTNVVRHAYEDDGGYMKVRLAISPEHVQVSVTDNGRGLDSVSTTTFRRNGNVTPGGLGIYIIKQLVDSVDYLSEKAGTEVRVVKHLHN
ncbi:MAG: ATP-binding protein [Candidatus Aquicultorales bacterium]